MNARPPSPRASRLYSDWREGAANHRGPSFSRAAVERTDETYSILSTHSLRLALILWIILGVAASIRTVVHPDSHTVFPIFASSAEHWWGNRSLYDLYSGLDRFRYPPVFALFVTPFSVLGLTAGGIVWTWMSIAVFLAGLWYYLRDVVPSSWSPSRSAVFLMLGGLGALRGLWNAQSNALIAGFVLLGSAALARAASGEGSAGSESGYYSPQPPRGTRLGTCWWLAAMFLAASVCLKLTPLALVLLFVMLWPRQLTWRLLVVMAGLFLLPFLTRPPDLVLDQYRKWIDHLLDSGNIRWLGFRDGWTVWIVVQHWLGGQVGDLSLREPMDSSWYRLVQLAAAALTLGWCLWQRHRCVRLDLGPRWLVHVTLSIGMAWLMLFGPAVEHATYVFLAPPLLWAALDNRAWPHGRGLIWASFALIMVLGWGAVTRQLAPQWPVVLTALPAGTALFALWLVGYARDCGIEAQTQLASAGEARYLISDRANPSTERRDQSTIPS